MTKRRAAGHVLAACAGLLASACTPVVIGRAGDESPLTGITGNLQSVPVRPAWQRVLNEGPIYRIKPHEFATAAYDPQGNRLGIGSRAGWFELLRASDGARLWRTAVPGGVSGTAVFDGPRVLAGTDDGRMLAFDVGSGRVLWEYKVQGAITQAPVVAGELVYFVDGTNSIYALGRADGAWRWQYRREPPADFALVGESGPCLHGGRVHVGFSDGFLVALDAGDGAVVWTRDLAPEHERFQDVDAAPVVVDGTLYAASAAAGLYALKPDTGEIRWSVPVAGITRMLPLDGDLVASSDQGFVARIATDSGRMVWQTRVTGGAPGQPVRLGDLVVFGVSRGSLYFIASRDGRPIRRFEPGYGVSATATVGTDGAMYVLSNGGVLYAFQPGAG